MNKFKVYEAIHIPIDMLICEFFTYWKNVYVLKTAHLLTLNNII